MPPLQAPPANDGDWYPPTEPADGPRAGPRKWAWLPAALVLALLLAGGAWLLLSDGNEGQGGTAGGTSAASTSSAGATGIQLDSSFIGRPADEVAGELEAAGLVVRREEADEDLIADVDEELQPGDVAGLDPSDTFAVPGTSVTLYVVPQGDDEPVETTQSPEPTSAAPSTSVAPTPTTTSSNTVVSSSATSSPSSSPPVESGLPAEPEPGDPEEPGDTGDTGGDPPAEGDTDPGAAAPGATE